MKALIFLLAFAGFAYAIAPECIPEYGHRQYVFAKGQAKVARPGLPDIVKGLRIELAYYASATSFKSIVAATGQTDDYGFYAIAGFSTTACRGGPRMYLNLYHDKLGPHALYTVGVPDGYAPAEGFQPMKVYERNITTEVRSPLH